MACGSFLVKPNFWLWLGVASGFNLILASCHKNDSASTSSLSVMAPSSFTSEFGPGPHLKREFEERCGCKVIYKNVGEGGLIVKKLKLGARVDVVMGLDQLSVYQMEKSLNWQKMEVVRAWNSHVRPIKNFLPYNWSPMTFIYRLGEITPPKTWSQLLSSGGKYKVSLQDPRSSTPGLQFLWWIHNVDIGQIKSVHTRKDQHMDLSRDTSQGKGVAREERDRSTVIHKDSQGPLEKTSLSEKLRSLTRLSYRISPSWSTAYGLFKAGHAHMVFSYLSSLLYHWNEEKDFKYQAVSFKSGHPIQVEYMGVLASSLNDKLARDFVEWILSPRGQAILTQYNYMFPAVGNQSVPNMPQLKILDHKNWQSFVAHLDDYIRVWEKSLH